MRGERDLKLLQDAIYSVPRLNKAELCISTRIVLSLVEKVPHQFEDRRSPLFLLDLRGSKGEEETAHGPGVYNFMGLGKASTQKITG